jgi:hypothetical protein
MAYTLAQLAKLETDPLRKYVMMNLLRYSRLMEYIPWTNVDSLKVIATRWKTLPSVAFRRINEGYTPNEGQDEQVWESLFALGGEIKFDRVFKKIKNTIVDPYKNETDKKLVSLALTFNDYLINGDHATDADGFEGLKKRVSGLPARQSVYFAGAAAAALDPTASTANGRAFFDHLEEMAYKTNRGQLQALLMNEGMIYGLGRVARYIQAAGGNWLDVTQDSFDRQIMTFKGAQCVDVGIKHDQSTEVITDAETAGDAGADATSIYGLSFDEQDGVIGIQLSDIEVYDPLGGSEQEATPTTLMRMEWWLGLAGFGSYGITRGRNVEGASNWT